MQWLAFALYLPLLSGLSFRAVVSWPRPASFLYGAVTLAVMWRSFRLGKNKDHASPIDVVMALVGLAGLLVLR